MLKPTDDDIKAVAGVARNHAAFCEWLDAWRTREINNLPYVVGVNSQIAQGRCQVLTELCKVVYDSPDLAAKLRKG